MSSIFILAIVALISYWLWRKLTYNHDFFKKQGLKHKTPVPLIGNFNYLKLFLGRGLLEMTKQDYKLYPGEKVIGMFDFFTPLFIIRSPEIVKQLTIKDFAYFQDHKIFSNANTDKLLKSVLFSLKGKEWREMRSSLSPLFTGSKMKNMIQLINNCSEQLVDFINEECVKKEPTPYSTKDIFSRYSTDVIATCAFGVECNSLKNPNNEIYLMGQKMLQFQKPSKMIQIFLSNAFPKLGQLLDLNLVDSKTRKQFSDIITQTMDARKRDGIVRPDMIQLLMKFREGQLISNETEINESEIKRNWTDEEIIAQCFVFFLAGFDTSSTVMDFASYELAVNPDIQDQLIDEIDKVAKDLNGNPLTYETLQKLKYLDMVISETLRKWPPAIFIDRECVQNYSYEDENGLKFTIEKGNVIWIPIYDFHRDPKYFPNPEKFDPERFSDENKSKIHADVYLPFGIGPRSCIGMRFALMELKSLMYHLFLNFRLKPSESTQIPLKLKKTGLGLAPEKQIRLFMEPRSLKRTDF